MGGVGKVQRSGKGEQLVFESDSVIKRAEKFGDLFFPVLTLKQKLPKLQETTLSAAA
jgi:hypothetical protein